MSITLILMAATSCQTDKYSCMAQTPQSWRSVFVTCNCEKAVLVMEIRGRRAWAITILIRSWRSWFVFSQYVSICFSVCYEKGCFGFSDHEILVRTPKGVTMTAVAQIRRGLSLRIFVQSKRSVVWNAFESRKRAISVVALSLHGSFQGRPEIVTRSIQAGDLSYYNARMQKLMQSNSAYIRVFKLTSRILANQWVGRGQAYLGCI